MTGSVFHTSIADWKTVQFLIDQRQQKIEETLEKNPRYKPSLPLPEVEEVELSPEELTQMKIPMGHIIFVCDHPASLNRLIKSYAIVLMHRRKHSKALHPRPPVHGVPEISLIGEAE